MHIFCKTVYVENSVFGAVETVLKIYVEPDYSTPRSICQMKQKKKSKQKYLAKIPAIFL